MSIVTKKFSAITEFLRELYKGIRRSLRLAYRGGCALNVPRTFSRRPFESATSQLQQTKKSDISPTFLFGGERGSLTACSQCSLRFREPSGSRITLLGK